MLSGPDRCRPRARVASHTAGSAGGVRCAGHAGVPTAPGVLAAPMRWQRQKCSPRQVRRPAPVCRQRRCTGSAGVPAAPGVPATPMRWQRQKCSPRQVCRQRRCAGSARSAPHARSAGDADGLAAPGAPSGSGIPGRATAHRRHCSRPSEAHSRRRPRGPDDGPTRSTLSANLRPIGDTGLQPLSARPRAGASPWGDSGCSHRGSPAVSRSPGPIARPGHALHQRIHATNPARSHAPGVSAGRGRRRVRGPPAPARRTGRPPAP